MKSSNVKVQKIFRRQNDITFSTNCKHRTAATLYILETWFFCRYSIVNTLHKGDNKDDDDDDDNDDDNNNNNTIFYYLY
jgi:hypothetical protein